MPVPIFWGSFLVEVTKETWHCWTIKVNPEAGTSSCRRVSCQGEIPSEAFAELATGAVLLSICLGHCEQNPGDAIGTKQGPVMRKFVLLRVW